MKKLNNWYLTGNVPSEIDPWQPPETQLPKVTLGGWVQNHSEFNDGEHITCSSIVSVTKVIDILFVTTLSGSIYELGEVEETYEKAFPKTKERLFNMFNKENPMLNLGRRLNFSKKNPIDYEFQFRDFHYKYIEKHGKAFSDALGIDDVTKSLVADGDKCYQYKDDWEDAGVPFVIGSMIYIASKESKYANTVRQTDNGFVKPCQWVIDKFKTDPEIITAVKAVRATYE